MFADLRLIGIYELHLFPNCEALAGMINFTASGTCWTITHQALCKALCFAWVFPFDLPASQWGRSFTCPHFTDEGWDIKRGSGVVKLCSYNMTKLLIQIFLNRTFWRPQRDLSFLERMVGWGIYPLVPIPQWLRIFPRRVNSQYSQALFKPGPNSFLKPLEKIMGQKSERHTVRGFDSFQQGQWGQLENIWGIYVYWREAWKCVVCDNAGQYYSQLICGCHEIKRHLLLGIKPVTNLDSVLKSRDITLRTKVCIVKAVIFPVVMYGCESWTIKKAEHQRIDALELWCWRKLSRVSWTARRSNQSILKEINLEYSLEGLMVKLKLQYFGHLTWRANSLKKTLMLGKIEGRRTRGQQRMRWLDGISDSMDWENSGR